MIASLRQNRACRHRIYSSGERLGHGVLSQTVDLIRVIAGYVTDYSARGIAEGISRAIRQGALAEGSKLPAIRVLAEEFQCSPTTVSAAWTLLTRAGLIRSDRRRGTIVVPRSRAGTGRYRRALEQTTGLRLDLSTGVPDPQLLPDLTAAFSRMTSGSASATYLTDPVVPGLRDVLESSWAFPAEVLTIVDGAMDALDLIVTTHLQYGDRVVVENPCFPPLLDLLDVAGVTIVPVELDEAGMVPASLTAALRAEPRAVFLQPRAQNPTGVSLTRERTAELVAVLAGHDAFVVENDSAAGIATTELHSLGCHIPRRTVHVRSYSKSHGPDLRLAAIGGASWLVEPIVNRRFLGQSWTSHLLQRLLLDLLTHPSSVEQVQHARDQYAWRRASLADELTALGIEVGGTDGLNLWVPVADEPSALIALTSQGVGVAPGSPFNAGAGPTRHLRVTSALLATGHHDVARMLANAAGR